jgi:hypothetical protein
MQVIMKKKKNTTKSGLSLNPKIKYIALLEFLDSMWKKLIKPYSRSYIFGNQLSNSPAVVIDP